jgi:hypothetical protein
MGTARDRLAAFGDELVRIHDWLRGELTGLRDEVGAHPTVSRDLTTHRLSFRSAVSRHHQGEDDGALSLLDKEFPELRQAVELLRQDHVLVSGLLQSRQRVLDGDPADPDTAAVRRIRGELDGLSAILESHFAVEERRIVDALNTPPAGSGTPESLLGGQRR